VGIVSLGIQVCNGIVKYYAQWKDYDDDIQATLNQIKELQALFQSCRTAIEDLEPVPEELLILLETQLQACKTAITRLQKYLKKLSAQLPGAATSLKDSALAHIDYRRKQLLYPFRQGTLGKLRDCVFEARNNLVPVLQALNLYVM
jgi:chaperonin cofactor prefoldin